MTSIRSNVSQRPVTKDNILDVMNREVVPLLVELRAAVQRLPYAPLTQNVTADATAVDGDILFVELAGTDIDITAPPPVRGARFVVKMVTVAGGNVINVLPYDSETFDGAASYTMSTDRDVAVFMCDAGETWQVIG